MLKLFTVCMLARSPGQDLVQRIYLLFIQALEMPTAVLVEHKAESRIDPVDMNVMHKR